MDRGADDYPHVTAILARVGLVEGNNFFREYDLVRGSAMHRATELLDQSDLDWASVDPVLLGRLRSYEKFRDDVRPTILSIEERVFNHTFKYQGRLDRRVIIDGREAVLDIKGPSVAAWQALQVCLYSRCFDRPLDRYTLHLGDETYRLVQHKGRNDWNASLAAITLAAWKDSVERSR
jgi:hypothetical protein